MKENLKQILENIVDDLIEQGVDLEETPALFTWRYPDNNMFKYQLLIIKSMPDEDELGEQNVH